MKKVTDISKYIPSDSDEFLFDTNVWIFLFAPIADYNAHIAKKYSKFFKLVTQSKAKIYTTLLVYSEFINTYLKLEFNILHEDNPTKYKNYKKDYRGTPEYFNAVKVLIGLVKKISEVSLLIDDSILLPGIEKIVDDITSADFNDICMDRMATLHNMKIITDDADFNKINSISEIISSNPKLIIP